MLQKAIMVAFVAVTITGCPKSEQERLVEMAERHLEQQAEQSRQMVELQHEVAEGSRQLVEADSRAREEIVALQRDIQAERSEIGRQRDTLEDERRELAANRRLDPIIAEAISGAGTILACALPLVLCWFLLRQSSEGASDQEIANLLISDLIAERPLLLTGPTSSSSDLLPDRTKPPHQGDPPADDHSDNEAIT